MSPLETDVAVVGAGPAGAAAALTITRHSALRCVLVDPDDLPGDRPGESVSPALLPMLDYLGAARPGADMLLPLTAMEINWGCRVDAGPFHPARPAQGAASLHRKRFDRHLVSTAERAGVHVLRGWRLRSAATRSDGWTLALTGPGRPVHVQARFVMDASGRASAFARMAGAKRTARDRLVGVVGYARVEGVRSAEPTFVLESVRDGWWYATSIPGGRVVIAFMTDADLIRDSGEDVATVFARRFGDTSAVRRRFGSAVPLAPPLAFPAETGRISQVAGDRWIAAGDAAASYDPLSSIGIGHAISSGIHAARHAHLALEQGADPAAYEADIRRQCFAHEQEQRRAYLGDTRWPDSPFWVRRHAAPATSVRPLAHVDGGCATRR